MSFQAVTLWYSLGSDCAAEASSTLPDVKRQKRQSESNLMVSEQASNRQATLNSARPTPLEVDTMLLTLPVQHDCRCAIMQRQILHPAGKGKHSAPAWSGLHQHSGNVYRCIIKTTASCRFRSFAYEAVPRIPATTPKARATFEISRQQTAPLTTSRGRFYRRFFEFNIQLNCFSYHAEFGSFNACRAASSKSSRAST